MNFSKAILKQSKSLKMWIPAKKETSAREVVDKVLDYNIIGQVGRVFVNGPGDLGSIPGRVIPKT